MLSRVEVILAGYGGQGVVVSGIILGAAGVYDGNYATQVQSYGPEARGGACKTEVVISGTPVYYPLVQKADILVAMSQEALTKYISRLNAEGTLFVDSDLVKHKQFAHVHEIPATDLASKELGKKVVANMIMLGSVARITKVVSQNALERATIRNVPKGTEDLNIRAIKLGYHCASSAEKTAAGFGKRPLRTGNDSRKSTRKQDK
jgi:2-oxoglutarate ferredoxin oxidoreductase subunit gamma